MKKTRIFLVVTLVLLSMGVMGCSESMAWDNTADTGQFITHARPGQSPWWEHGGININWPY